MITASAILFLPSLFSSKEVEVPDVSGMSVVKAERKLEDAGFKVGQQTKEVASDKIDEGDVVKTNPPSARSVKEGTTITLYVSSGAETFELEDYTGKNVNEVKAILEEVHNLNVMIESKRKKR